MEATIGIWEYTPYKGKDTIIIGYIWGLYRDTQGLLSQVADAELAAVPPKSQRHSLLIPHGSTV